MSDTELQFGQRVAGPASEPPCPTRCPRCGQHFSPDGRFCPFDGEPLVCATDWDPSGDPLLDQTIDGRYLVEAVIGEGGMGTVYRVRHTSLGKRLALKALRADLTNDAEIAARFIHEARIAASVSHPGLVQILDFGTLPSGQPYLVMELLDGMPLSSLLRRHGVLSPARAAAIACKIAEALGALHAVSVVHRDLKPDNVQIRVLDGSDDVKVVDFGLAKIIGGNRLTRQGVVFGTPHYMSPEQASGQPIDVRADVYALGVVLYEMLVGRVPFEADTYMGVLTQHIYLRPVAPSERHPGSSGLGPIESIVLRCLQKQPEKRFQSMAELLAAFAALPAGALPQSAPPAPAPPLPAPPAELLNSSALEERPTRRKAIWLGAALGAAIGALVVGWGVHAALQHEATPQALAPRAAVPEPVPAVAPPPQPSQAVAAAAPAASEQPSVAEQTNAPAVKPSHEVVAGRAAASTRSAKPLRSTGSKTSRAASAGSDIIDPWEKKR
ncbi:MAG: protein kinase domain-containing protein [Myxococcota bacterium]